MAKSIKQLQQDLAHLEDNVSRLVEQLQRQYTDYFKVLSQSARQALILATYRICTQVAPEAFLQRSFSQRQKLQEAIRHLGNQIESQLTTYLAFPKPALTPSTADLIEQMLLPVSQTTENTEESPETQLDDPEPSITHPDELILWCKQIEQGINETLERVSEEANLYLQKDQILTPKLPPKLLQMALQAEEGGMTLSSDSPNILNLLVETHPEQSESSEDENKEASITKVTAIHLRLSEIEFADPTLTLERKKVHQLLEQVGQLRQHYRQTQKELATAEAESAWRASWTNE